MTTIPFGIIGCGLMGRELASAMARWLHLAEMDARAELVAVCDRNDERRRWLAERVPSVRQSTADYRELLANPDVEAVYCAVPHNLHQEIYCAIIAAGKHLLGEKPFGIDQTANDAILACAARHPRQVRPLLLRDSRSSRRPAHLAMIESGAFGRVIEVNTGFLHSSDLDPDKPINWKRLVEVNGEYGVHGRSRHARLPRAVPRRLAAAQRARRALQHRQGTARRQGRPRPLPDLGQRHAALRNGRPGGGRRLPLDDPKLQRIAPGEKNTWYIEIKGTKGCARFSTKNPKLLETLHYTGGEQSWQQTDIGYEPAFKAITGGIFEFGFSDACQQMLAAFTYEAAHGRAAAAVRRLPDARRNRAQPPAVHRGARIAPPPGHGHRLTLNRNLKMNLLAGCATRDISPTEPMFLAGYPHVPRTSTGVHDPLLASALYLADGRTALLLIGVDSLFISQRSTAWCREAISRETGIPAGQILISATHTHSGPVTGDELAWLDDPVVPPPDPAIHGALPPRHHRSGRGRAAGRRAGPPRRDERRGRRRRRQPARSRGTVRSRGRPAGPPGRSRRTAGWRSTWSMACIRPSSTRTRGSSPPTFPHFVRREIAEAFPGATTIYHNGPSGNLSPRYHVRGQTFAEAERLGRRLGGSVVRSLRALQDGDFRGDIRLAARQGKADLVPNRFPPVAEAEAKLRQAREHHERLKLQGAAHGPLRTAECVVFGAEQALALAGAQASGEVAKRQADFGRAEVQAFRIGNVDLVALPGEHFVEYGLEIKRRAPGRAFVISQRQRRASGLHRYARGGGRGRLRGGLGAFPAGIRRAPGRGGRRAD